MTRGRGRGGRGAEERYVEAGRGGKKRRGGGKGRGKGGRRGRRAGGNTPHASLRTESRVRAAMKYGTVHAFHSKPFQKERKKEERKKERKEGVRLIKRFPGVVGFGFDAHHRRGIVYQCTPGTSRGPVPGRPCSHARRARGEAALPDDLLEGAGAEQGRAGRGPLRATPLLSHRSPSSTR